MQSEEIAQLPLPAQWPGGFQIICPQDRVCVIHIKEMRNFRGGPVVYEAGTVSLGTVHHVDCDGFFDLYTDSGDAHGYYVNDPTLRVQVLSRDPSNSRP
jgi:hypothetical protein